VARNAARSACYQILTHDREARGDHFQCAGHCRGCGVRVRIVRTCYTRDARALRPYSAAAGNRDGKPCGRIRAETGEDSVVLMFWSLQAGGWTSIEQQVPITWTTCRLGGRRPRFLCDVHTNGQHCGRRVAVIYNTGGLFACRVCHGLSYASQREPLRHRGLAPRRRYCRRRTARRRSPVG
jgi:hypothetical protein